MKILRRSVHTILFFLLSFCALSIASAQSSRDVDRGWRELDRQESLRMQRELLDIEQQRLQIDQERASRDRERGAQQTQKELNDSLGRIDQQHRIAEQVGRENDLKVLAIVASMTARAESNMRRAEKVLEEAKVDAKKLKTRLDIEVDIVPSSLSTPYETSTNFLRSSLAENKVRCNKTAENLGKQASSGSIDAKIWSLQKQKVMLSHCHLLHTFDFFIFVLQVNRHVSMLRAKETSATQAKNLEAIFIKANKEFRDDAEATVKSNNEAYWAIINM